MIERIAWQRMEMPSSAVQPGSQELANFMAHVADIRDSQNITWYSGLRARDPHSIIGAILDAHRRRPVDCVWIDHIGKIAHVGERNESLPTRIGHTSEALANLALRLDAPVMALCQLNRDAADGEPPQLTDLRDSGALEQDARFVWMPHRPGYYMDPRPPKNRPQVLDIYQRKVQDGNADTIGLMWRDDCARIYPRQFGR
jgi:replicative DNA helicase